MNPRVGWLVRIGACAAIAGTLTGGCAAPGPVAVHQPDQLPVALDGVTRALVTTRTVATGADAAALLDGFAWLGGTGPSVDIYALLDGRAWVGTLTVALGPDSLSCDDGADVPAAGEGLLLTWQWSAETEDTSWDGSYPVGTVDARDGASRTLVVRAWDRGGSAILAYLAGDGTLEVAGDGSAVARLVSDVVDVDADATPCDGLGR